MNFFPSFFVLFCAVCCCFCSERSNPSGILFVNVSLNPNKYHTAMWICVCMCVCEFVRSSRARTSCWRWDAQSPCPYDSVSLCSHDGWIAFAWLLFALLLRCASSRQTCMRLCRDAIATGYQQCAEHTAQQRCRNSFGSSELLINNPLCPMNRLVLYLAKLWRALCLSLTFANTLRASCMPSSWSDALLCECVAQMYR